MFNRRKRASSMPARHRPHLQRVGPHQGPPVATAASTAAAQAFLANRAKSGNLSSAAAAAALRSLTSSPVQVGEIQTKRMIRRGSTSSNGSNGPGLLRRQSSSGSMSERTFRDQSPGGRPSESAAVHPPMPAIPKAYASSNPSKKGPRRPMSAEPPELTGSPLSRLQAGRGATGGRGVSLDRGPSVLPPPRSTNKVQTLRQNLPELSPPPPESRRASVNFSRPMSPANAPSPHNTPPVSPIHSGPRSKPQSQRNQHTNTAANTAVLAEAERENIIHAVNDVANAPVKVKKKKVVPHMTEGSHLAAGTNYAKPTGAAVEDSLVSDSDVSEQSFQSDRPRSFTARGNGGLTKKPSIVREDREAEDIAESAATPKPKIQNGFAKETPKSNTGSKIVPKADSLTAPVQLPETDDQFQERTLSPTRSTRFSTQPTYETPNGRKHQPPPRSVSPAKSAMKHSPSPRGPSPVGSSLTGSKAGHDHSEFSDTGSMVSDEGLKARKRRTTRVSFDDEPVIVGQAAKSQSPTSPVMSSPQDKTAAKRGWFPFARDKGKVPHHSLPEEDDGVIQPVPILPSFGSVRSRMDTPGTAEASAPLGENTNSSPRSRTTSNDNISSRILVHNQGSTTVGSEHHASNDPLPPEVTTVEGSGYHSDTESLLSTNDEIQDQSRPSHGAREPPSLTKEVLDSTMLKTDDTNVLSAHAAADVPSIAVQPATPGIEAMGNSNRSSWLDMPGGFSSKKESTDSVEDSASVDPISETTPSVVGIAEPEPEPIAAYHDPGTPVVGQVSDSIRQQIAIPEEDEVSDDTGNSIYSDAAEDQSDLEGDGFGSINAIVESPAPPSKKKRPVSPPPKSPARQSKPIKASPPSQPSPDEGWDKAQSYWSGLSSSRKAEIEHAASTPTREPPQISEAVVDQPVIANVETVKTIQPKPKVTKESSLVKATDPVTKTAKKTPSLKKSMRGDSESSLQGSSGTSAPNQLRSSMRVGSRGSTRLAGSMRDGTSNKASGERSGTFASTTTYSPPSVPKGTLQKKTRPVSSLNYGSPVAPANGNSRPRAASVDGPTAASLRPKRASAPPVPALRRRLSNGSDSDSSFKRVRENKASKDGRVSMKRSLRAGSVTEHPRSTFSPPPPQPQSSRPFSVRSLSPTGASRRPGSLGTMRASLRATAEPERAKSPVRSLFGRSSKSKSKTKAPPIPQKAASRFSSRFNDSDDEEDSGPRVFSSRFADSSDEEEAAPLDLTPVRGIPRRVDEGDSTDLEESDEELQQKQNTKAPPPLTIPDNKASEGGALTNGTLRHSGSGRGAMGATKTGAGADKKKRPFFGNLGRRKDKTSKIGKVDIESAARRDTPLERSRFERDALSKIISPEEAQTPTDSTVVPDSPASLLKSPRLQRRNPHRVTSDSWPLPPSIPNSPSTPVRPVTSDGTRASTRPTLGSRGFSAVSATTGKKKRFPMLRKAFGLHD